MYVHIMFGSIYRFFKILLICFFSEYELLSNFESRNILVMYPSCFPFVNTFLFCRVSVLLVEIVLTKV